MTRVHPVSALAGLAAAALMLTGCTSAFLAEGGGVNPEPAPTETAAPEPTPTSAPVPEPDYDCDNLVLNRPGHYVIGACGSVTVEGTGIDLSFSTIETLVVRGDRADLVGGAVGSIEINGQGSELSVESVREVRIRGERNAVLAEGAIGSVVVDGNENVVTSGRGIGATIDNGLLNEIS